MVVSPNIISLALPLPNTSVLTVTICLVPNIASFPRRLPVQVSLGYEPRATRVGNLSLI
jgi:hypothetical protein